MLSLRHPYEKTAATECFLPNYELCLNELAPLGIRVERVDAGEEPLPFKRASFDMILNRHGAYDAGEVFRCLAPGGVFITEQVGSRNNMQLSRRLLPDYSPANPKHDLAHAEAEFRAAGFELLAGREAFPKLRFFDIGALVYYAGIIEWEFPGFSVERCSRELLTLQRELEETGRVDGLEHRFLIIAKKPGGKA